MPASIRLEQLIRMAVEADDVARAGATRSPEIDRVRRRASLWRVFSPVLAAAAGLLLLFQFAQPNRTVPARLLVAADPAIYASLDYCPTVATITGARVDRFQPSVGERCVVLAIFHSWQDECQCLQWEFV